MLSPYRIISSTPVVDKKFPTNASISLNGTRDENDDDHHSHYLSFEDVFNLFPLNCNFKTVSIYGIIESFDSSNGTLLLMDQTRKHFAVYANIVPPKSEKSRTRLPTRPGDIIRIIDLRLHSNFTKTCSDVANCVIFESFQDLKFNPLSVNQTQKFEAIDHQIVETLTDFNLKYIMNAVLRPLRNDCLVVDVAFQILCTFKYDYRYILACYNGRPFNSFPCIPLIKFAQIIDSIDAIDESNCYTEEFLHKIYHNHEITFISVYGSHRCVAMSLQPLDTIIVYNLLIKHDKFNYGKFSYFLYDGQSFGKYIRVAKRNSEIAQRIRAQIENESLNYENSIFSEPVSIVDVTDESIIAEENQELDANQQSCASFALTDTLDESFLTKQINHIPCEHYDYDQYEKEILYRHFYSELRGNLVTELYFQTFADFINKTEIKNKFFQIKAKFYSFVLDKTIDIFESMSTLRKYATMVQCTSTNSSPNCNYQETFDEFLKQCESFYEEKEGKLSYKMDSNKPILNLHCPNCDQLTCILCLDFFMLLQDYDNALLLTRLAGIDANIFFPVPHQIYAILSQIL
ncbi:hypothetical protein SSS_02866 [Sarcoptes scabiei]|nr:hypothetical protein SSS_02866 [Sarcoptes scabiei]